MALPREFAELPRIKELITAPNRTDINCHKAVLFLAGLITDKELTSDSKAEREQGSDFTYEKRARAISDKEFILITNSDQLYDLAERECGHDSTYIGQILDAANGEMAHSFILVRKGGDFMCFDKAGFKDNFKMYFLGDLLSQKNYRNQLWRFLPLVA